MPQHRGCRRWEWPRADGVVVVVVVVVGWVSQGNKWLWLYGDTMMGTYHKDQARRYEIIYLPGQSFCESLIHPSKHD